MSNRQHLRSARPRALRRSLTAAAVMAPVAAIALGSSPGAASASTFSITPWGLPQQAPGGSAIPSASLVGPSGWAVNSSGTAAGTGQVGNDPGSIAGVTFDPATNTAGPTVLDNGFADVGWPTDSWQVYTTGINDSGFAVGYAHSNNPSGTFPYQAVFWSGGQMHEINPDHNIVALAVNDNDVMVGAEMSPSIDETSHAIIFDAPGTANWQDLGGLNSLSNPPVRNDRATGISDDNQIVGSAFTDSGLGVAVFFNGGQAGIFTVPNGASSSVAPGGVFSEVDGISRTNGFTVGQVAASGGPEAVQFTGNTTDPAFAGSSNPVWLGMLSGDTCSQALAVNSSGTAVGESGSSCGTSSLTGKAAMFVNGVVVDLNSYLPLNSGWQLVQADGISDGNTVVGVGYLNGALQGFTMTLPTNGGSGTPQLPIGQLPPYLNIPLSGVPLVGPTLNGLLNRVLGF